MNEYWWDFDKIIAPVFLPPDEEIGGVGHWCLGVFDHILAEVRIYDSLSSQSSKTEERLTTMATSFHRSFDGSKKRPPYSVRVCPCPQQISTDCGISVCVISLEEANVFKTPSLKHDPQYLTSKGRKIIADSIENMTIHGN